MAYKFTPQERKQQNRGANAGASAGLVGGGAAGYYGVKGAQHVGEGAKGAKTAYQGSRRLSRNFGAGGSRLKDAGTALRTGATAARKLPKTAGGSFSRFMGGYAGAAIGTAAGAGIGGTRVVNRQKKEKDAIGKISSVSAFGVDHG